MARELFGKGDRGTLPLNSELSGAGALSFEALQQID
jgi:hypothetical protein